MKAASAVEAAPRPPPRPSKPRIGSQENDQGERQRLNFAFISILLANRG